MEHLKRFLLMFIGVILLYGCSENNTLEVEFQSNSVIEKDQDLSMFVTWNLSFNEEIDVNTINEDAVYMTDSKGEKVSVEVNVMEDQQNLQILPPQNGYEQGETYTINVTHLLQSNNGNHVEEVVEKSFTIHPHQLSIESAQLKSRFTTTMKDEQGHSYTVYVLGINDEKKVATSEEVWAGASLGDVFYNGDFEIGIQLEKDNTVLIQPLKIENYQYNQTAQSIFKVPSKTEVQPDFLFISEKEASTLNSAKVYYLQDYELKQATVQSGDTKDELYYYFIRPKSIGENRLQQFHYANVDYTGYIVTTYTFNPDTGVFQLEGEKSFLGNLSNIGNEIVNRFNSEEDYYYEMNLNKRYEKTMSNFSVYHHEKLGFSFLYPKEWDGKTEFREETLNGETSISVYYVNNNIEQSMFSIVAKKEFEYIPIVTYFGSSGEYHYYLLKSPEPAPELLDPKNEQILLEVMTMINQEIDIVLESFEFE